MFKKDEKDLEGYKEILNKLLELENAKGKNDPIKITICIAGGIASVMFIGLICYSIIKNEFSLESILSMLLAFFSIFISIFFYFKADETSSKFYNSSYDFMKDISVTLGKIEERFGEKLNSLNDKISHLDKISSEKTEEIQNQEEDKDKIINELMNKANLNEEEKAKYKKELEEKELIIECLKREQFDAQREAERLRKRKGGNYLKDRWEPNRDYLISLLNEGIKGISVGQYSRLVELGLINEEGKLDKERIIDRLNDISYWYE
ncbi:MAG: hypothetical protein IKT67_09270 [Lachnospiraceae bacterium]|nr:hypothetical protein [Lachnospiraceae bacterium]